MPLYPPTISGPASSVDSEISIYSGTTGKIIKRAANTGILKASSGVIATATAGTDYLTANQSISLTGDVTGSGTTSIACTIPANSIALADMATMATDSILGRATAATGNVEVLTALPFAYTGDVTRAVDSNTTVLANIPTGTTIGGVAGTRGDVLYYGASGWAKLAAGTSGNQLTTNGAGADPTWAAPGSGGSGTPGGSTTQVQFNDAGAFAGDADFTWDKTNNTLAIVPGAPGNGLKFIAGTGSTNSPSVYFYEGATYRGVLGLALAATHFSTSASTNDFVLAGNSNLLLTSAGTQGISLISGSQLLKFDPNGVLAFGTALDVALTRNASGTIEVNNGTAGTYRDLKLRGLYLSGTTVGNLQSLGNSLMISGNGATQDLVVDAARVGMRSGQPLSWVSSALDAQGGTADTGFSRNTAGVVEVNNGTAGTYRDIIARTHNATSGYQINGIATAGDYINSSVSSQTPAAVDVYVTGSNIVVPAGGFAAKGQYRCVFDIVKSAGTGTIVVSLRIGTTGTVASDTARITFTFPAAGTTVADTGNIEVCVNWRTVGSGTSAVVAGFCRAAKNTITAAGLWSTTTAAQTIVGTVSGGFDSSAATTIGLSFNGSTAFAGTITTVQASLAQ